MSDWADEMALQMVNDMKRYTGIHPDYERRYLTDFAAALRAVREQAIQCAEQYDLWSNDAFEIARTIKQLPAPTVTAK